VLPFFISLLKHLTMDIDVYAKGMQSAYEEFKVAAMSTIRYPTTTPALNCDNLGLPFQASG
jgi:hypothetical protein